MYFFTNLKFTLSQAIFTVITHKIRSQRRFNIEIGRNTVTLSFSGHPRSVEAGSRLGGPAPYKRKIKFSRK
jgi:hypothetical protein